MADFVGWVGSVLLAVCGAPQAIQSFRQGHSRGISPWFLAFWLVGELSYVYSTAAKFGFVGWLVFNYVGNIVFVLVIIYYALFPRGRVMITEREEFAKRPAKPLPQCESTASV